MEYKLSYSIFFDITEILNYNYLSIFLINPFKIKLKDMIIIFITCF